MTSKFLLRNLLRGPFTEPAPEPVTFDTAVEPTTGNIQVKGVTR